MHFDAAEAGVVYGSLADQAAGLQDAIDFAAKRDNGSLQISGIVRAARPLSNPANVPIIGLGSGDSWKVSPSAILFDVDVAEPKRPAIAFANSSRPVVVRGITLAGPAWSTATPLGQLPANLYGLGVPCRCLVQDVRIHGFGAAIAASNRQHRYRDADFRGNGYAVDLIDTPDGSTSDLLFDGCSFNEQSRAGIGLSDSSVLANARFKGNCSFGASPFAVYRYKGAAPDRRQAMMSVVFDNTTFGTCGNALFYDEPGTASWTNVEFNTPGNWGAIGAYAWPGKPVDLALIDVGTVDGMRWTASTFAGQKRPAIRADRITKVTMDKFEVNNVLDNKWKPFVIRTPYNQWGEECDGITLGSFARLAGDTVASARVADESIGKGLLVEMVGYGHVRRSRGVSPSLIVGVAVDTFNRGDVCVFASQFDSYALGVVNTTQSTIPQGALVEPDPGSPGGVRPTSVRLGSIGRVNDAPIPSGSRGRAQVSL
jgi:hypothetical protein